MAFAPGFDKHLRRALENKLSAYKWIAGCRAEDIDRGKGTAIQERATRERADQRWMVDVAGLPKKKGAPVVLVEVELKKDNPVENVSRFGAGRLKESIQAECCSCRRFQRITGQQKLSNECVRNSLANR